MIFNLPPVSLIINADDFNLTEGVSRGILSAHDRGVVTSTSVMINLPLVHREIRELRKRKKLGAGLHLNITLGRPLLKPARVASLIRPDGYFRKRSELDFKRISKPELASEYRAQVETFRKIFNRFPTHLDTHHHLHENRTVFEVLRAVAFDYRIPFRISRQCNKRVRKVFRKAGVRLTDYLLEDLESAGAWSKASLLRTLRHLRPGFYELMCHPAFCDRKLVDISSFNQSRERELKALLSPEVRRLLQKKKIRCISFAELKGR